MPNLTKSLCWAAAMLLVAAGNRFGLVADKTADVLLVVLPVAAAITLAQRRCDLLGRMRKSMAQ